MKKTFLFFVLSFIQCVIIRGQTVQTNTPRVTLTVTAPDTLNADGHVIDYWFAPADFLVSNHIVRINPNSPYFASSNLNIGINASIPTPTNVSLIPIMTSDTSPAGTASSSSDFGSSQAAWKAFDGSTSDYWLPFSAPPCWVEYTFGSDVQINSFYVLFTTSTTWRLDASSNNVDFTTLFNFSTNSGGAFNLTNTPPYSTYRIYQNLSGSGVEIFQVYNTITNAVSNYTFALITPYTITHSTNSTFGFGAGLIGCDTNYIYVSTGTNAWSRIAFTTNSW